MTKYNPKLESGYALLEVMLAFGLGIVVIAGMVSLGVSSVKSLTSSRTASEAGKIAQREVIRLKLLRDSLSWYNGSDGFFDLAKECTSKCYIDPTSSPFTLIKNSSNREYVDGYPIEYFLTMDPDPSSNRSFVKYTVWTRWELRGVSKDYKIEGVLTNWGEL